MSLGHTHDDYSPASCAFARHEVIAAARLAKAHEAKIQEALDIIRLVLEDAPEDSRYTKELCDAEGSLTDGLSELKGDIAAMERVAS